MTNDKTHSMNDGCCVTVAMNVFWGLGWLEFSPAFANMEERSFPIEGLQESAIQIAVVEDD